MLKVASYNMRKGVGLDRKRSPERILDVLNEMNADVIALQEADRRFGARVGVITPQLLADHSDWQAVDFGMRAASMGWHGNALLVRKAATVTWRAPIHLPALEPRGAVTATVALPGGDTVRVVGMHLDLSGLWRRRQAAAVITAVEQAPRPLPTVLMGDLNEWTNAGCLRDFARVFRFAATGPSFHAKRPVGRLDRIMVTPDLHVVECGVHMSACARKASDHLPIWAVLESSPLPLAGGATQTPLPLAGGATQTPLPLAGGAGGGDVPPHLPATDTPSPNPSRKREGD